MADIVQGLYLPQVEAGTPETWTLTDADTRVHVLVVPLYNADRAIIYTPLIPGSPFVINTRPGRRAETITDVTDIVEQTFSGFVDGTHLAFLWLWMFGQEVLRECTQAQTTLTPFVINVAPWREALADGITTDKGKQHLASGHKLMLLKQELEHVKELEHVTATLAHDRVAAENDGPEDQQLLDCIELLEARSRELMAKIQKSQAELGKGK